MKELPLTLTGAARFLLLLLGFFSIQGMADEHKFEFKGLPLDSVPIDQPVKGEYYIYRDIVVSNGAIIADQVKVAGQFEYQTVLQSDLADKNYCAFTVAYVFKKGLKATKRFVLPEVQMNFSTRISFNSRVMSFDKTGFSKLAFTASFLSMASDETDPDIFMKNPKGKLYGIAPYNLECVNNNFTLVEDATEQKMLLNAFGSYAEYK